MTALTVHTCCQYLTAGDNWRDEDYNARVVVKSVKGKPFKGYFDVKVGGVAVRLSQDNMDVGLDMAGMVMASRLVELTDTPVTLIAVPNSNACVGAPVDFRTLMLVRAIIKHAKGMANPGPLILWKAPRAAQHQQGGYRHASQFIPHLSVPNATASPVVLIDDVITSGSQMLACTYLLRRNGIEVPFGLAVGRATQTQMPNPLAWNSEVLTQMII